MRLSGEIIVGGYARSTNPGSAVYEDPERYAFFLSRPEQPPTSLWYSTDLDWPRSHISMITAYSEQGRSGTLEEACPPCPPPPDQSPSIFLHSHAPLENIRRVRVFYSSTQSCKGILVDYDDGGQRALGQCQLHVDPSDTFERPFRIAFLNVTTFPGYTEVLFDKLPSADDPQLDDWLYYEMAGTLNFWFSTSQGHMAVRGGREIPQMDLWEEVPPEELLLMKQVGEDS